MLEGGDDPGRLEPAHVGGADGGHQVGVLAEGLLDAAPAQVAGDVQDGGEPLVDAEPAHGPADARGHALDEAGVEGGAPGRRDRVDGGPPGGQAGQALLVCDGRDAEPVGGHDLALAAGQGGAARDRVHRGGAEGPGELAQAVLDHLLPGEGFTGGVVLVGGDRGAGGVGTHPDAVELGRLLLQGHGGEQVVDPLAVGQGGVPPGTVQGFGGWGHREVPFPWSRKFRKFYRNQWNENVRSAGSRVKERREVNHRACDCLGKTACSLRYVDEGPLSVDGSVLRKFRSPVAAGAPAPPEPGR